jgi:hypothetical protein
MKKRFTDEQIIGFFEGSSAELRSEKLSYIHVCKRLETGRLQCARKRREGRPRSVYGST